MKILKNNYKFLICFNAKELVLLLLSENFDEDLIYLINNLNNFKKAKKIAKEWAKKSVNSKNYELWTAIFNLYEDFDKNCDFCFYLKDNVEINKIFIRNLNDLEKIKEDPPDIVIYKGGKFAEFELKRYRGNLNEIDLYHFIEEEIIKHYSEPYNFLIILQPKPGTKLSYEIFKKIYEKFKKISSKKLGRIVISFNQNNKEMIYVSIYPEFGFVKKNLLRGSDQIKEILTS